MSWSIFVAILIGLTAHFFKKMAEAKLKSENFSIGHYWMENWIASASSLSTLAGALFLAHYAGQLNEVSAFSMSVSINSASDYIRAVNSAKSKK